MSVRFSGLICWLLTAVFSVATYAQTAKFDIEGLDQQQLKQNVQLHLQTLEAPGSRFQFEDFALQAQKKALIALNAYGYYQSQISVTPADDKGLQWKIQIEAGKPVLIRSLKLEILGEGKQDKQLNGVLSESGLKQGNPLNQSKYEDLKSRLQAMALARGYFDFSFNAHSLNVSKSSLTADIILIADSGNRYSFGKLQYSRDERTEALIAELQPFKQGEPYIADKLAELSQALKKTRYFRHVLVRPLVAEANNNQVPIALTLIHMPRDNFDLGGGFSSDDIGPRFRAKWERPWVNRYGHSMSAELFASQVEQHASFDYKIPLSDPVKHFLSLQLGYQALQDNDTDSSKYTLSVQRHIDLDTLDWQRIDFIRYEHEEYRQGSDEPQTANLFIPGVTFSRLRSRGGLDLDWGDKQMITLEGAGDDVGSDVNFLRISALTRWLRSIGDHRFLLRAEAGAIATDDFDAIPSSLRYFAGGDQSIRGFGYRNLAPKDDAGELIGGRYLAVVSAEYSYPVADTWRAALFIDAGNAANKFKNNIATGAGLGAIWQSPVGPVRIYAARGHSDYENTWRLHLLMGPSL